MVPTRTKLKAKPLQGNCKPLRVPIISNIVSALDIGLQNYPLCNGYLSGSNTRQVSMVTNFSTNYPSSMVVLKIFGIRYLSDGHCQSLRSLFADFLYILQSFIPASHVCTLRILVTVTNPLEKRNPGPNPREGLGLYLTAIQPNNRIRMTH